MIIYHVEAYTDHHTIRSFHEDTSFLNDKHQVSLESHHLAETVAETVAARWHHTPGTSALSAAKSTFAKLSRYIAWYLRQKATDIRQRHPINQAVVETTCTYTRGCWRRSPEDLQKSELRGPSSSELRGPSIVSLQRRGGRPAPKPSNLTISLSEISLGSHCDGIARGLTGRC